MIYFLSHVSKWLQCHSIYWAIDDARAADRVLGMPMAYCHITRYANCVADNMAKWALEA